MKKKREDFYSRAEVCHLLHISRDDFNLLLERTNIQINMARLTVHNLNGTPKQFETVFILKSEIWKLLDEKAALLKRKNLRLFNN